MHFWEKGSPSCKVQIYTDSHSADEPDLMGPNDSDWSNNFRRDIEQYKNHF